MQKTLFGITALTLAMMGDASRAYAACNNDGTCDADEDHASCPADCPLDKCALDVGPSTYDKPVVVKPSHGAAVRFKFSLGGGYDHVTLRQPDGSKYFRIDRSGNVNVTVIGFDEDGALVCQSEGKYIMTFSGGGAAKRRAPDKAAGSPAAKPAASTGDFYVRRVQRDGSNVGVPTWKREDRVEECSGPDRDSDGKGDTCSVTVVKAEVPLIDADALDASNAQLRAGAQRAAQDAAQAQRVDHEAEEHGTWAKVREVAQTVGTVLGTVALAILIL